MEELQECGGSITGVPANFEVFNLTWNGDEIVHGFEQWFCSETYWIKWSGFACEAFFIHSCRWLKPSSSVIRHYRDLEVSKKSWGYSKSSKSLPSGYVKLAIENGPVEIVDFPMKKIGGSFNSYVTNYHEGKPPFSYGFPMVFQVIRLMDDHWFLYWNPWWRLAIPHAGAIGQLWVFDPAAQ